jgi:hypothetical protein
MGAKYAWLTAKHGCGFLLWPTKTKLPNGQPYGYDVGAADSGCKVDIVGQWMSALRAKGIGPGLYYSLKDNYFLNSAAGGLVKKGQLLPGQGNVSQAEYEKLALDQLAELWGGYGSLSETWFDGAYDSLDLDIALLPCSPDLAMPLTLLDAFACCAGGWAPDMLPALKQLIMKYLPHTAAFGGLGITPNAVKWAGSEEPAMLHGPVSMYFLTPPQINDDPPHPPVK